MNLGRALMAALMVASIGAGCGSGDDDSDDDDDTSQDDTSQSEATSPAAPNTEPENAGDDANDADAGDADDTGGGDVAGFGDNGGVEFTISGGHELSGEFIWIPVASSHAPGWWAMNFTDQSADSAAVLSLSLDPANTNVSFGDGEITIYGAAPECSFDIDHQDESGASGSFECTGLTAITAAEMIPDVSFSGTFDATT